jgi:hypothetical protein
LDFANSIQPRTGTLFPSTIASDEWYLWDNYGYIEEGQMHIYAQAADKKSCRKPEDRYWQAYWRHFSSEDGGKSWIDEGPALWPQKGPKAYDSYNIWSGSVLVRKNGMKIAAYTGLAAGKLALQSIAIAISKEGHQFWRVSQDRPLLSAELDYERLIEKGYYLGPKETIGDIEREADGTFLCLRDPFLFEDQDEKLHIFFGAKALLGDDIVRAVGHAVFCDPEQLHAVELLSPIFVPDGDQFNQLELPNVFQHDGIYYLVISTTNLAYIGQPDSEAQKSVRIYRSKFLDREWKPYGDSGKHIILTPESKLYGLNILNNSNRTGNNLTCRAFWVGKTFMPPSIYLQVGSTYPQIVFPNKFWGEPSGV